MASRRLYAAFIALALALFSNMSRGDEPLPVDKPAAVAKPAPGQNEWPKSLKEIATKLGAVAAEK